MISPKVSVVIPVYKVEKYLRQCLDSVINQTLKDIEIIIVDEGDLDECRRIIDEYEAKDSRIKTIHEKNGGYGVSVNKGFDKAIGEYLAIVESDDFIEPTMYEEMYAQAKKFDADIVKTPFYEFWDEIQRVKNYKKVNYFESFVTNNVPNDRVFDILEFPHLMSIHPSVWSALYKRDYLNSKNIRFIKTPKANYIDLIFRISVFMEGAKIFWLNKPFYNYRMDNENSTVSNFKIEQMIERFSEIHEMFNSKYKGLYEKIASFLIAEEYATCVSHLKEPIVKKFTDENFRKLKENLALTTSEEINASTLMKKKHKKELLEIKRKKCFKACNIFKTETYVLFSKIPLLVYKTNCIYNKYYLFGFVPIYTKIKKGSN